MMAPRWLKTPRDCGGIFERGILKAQHAGERDEHSATDVARAARFASALSAEDETGATAILREAQQDNGLAGFSIALGVRLVQICSRVSTTSTGSGSWTCSPWRRSPTPKSRSDGLCSARLGFCQRGAVAAVNGRP